MNAVSAEQRVGDDVERDEQAVVPDHQRVCRARLRDERVHLVAERARLNRSACAADGRRHRTRGRCARRCASANAAGVGSSTSMPVSSGDDGFERAAAAERDDRPAAGLRFERHDAEVFFAGQQHDRRAAVQRRESLRPTARPRNSHVAVRRRARARARSGPSPTIFSGTPRQAAGVDGEVDPLVGDQRRHDERESLGRGVVRDEKSRCRRADTPQSPRDYSIGGSCPQHNER